MKIGNKNHYDLVNGYFLNTSASGLSILTYMSEDLYVQYNQYMMNKTFSEKAYSPIKNFCKTCYSGRYLSKVDNFFSYANLSIQGIDILGIENGYIVGFSCNKEFENKEQAISYFKDEVLPGFKKFNIETFLDEPQVIALIDQYIAEEKPDLLNIELLNDDGDFLKSDVMPKEELLERTIDDLTCEYIADKDDFSLGKYLEDTVIKYTEEAEYHYLNEELPKLEEERHLRDEAAKADAADLYYDQMKNGELDDLYEHDF